MSERARRGAVISVGANVQERSWIITAGIAAIIIGLLFLLFIMGVLTSGDPRDKEDVRIIVIYTSVHCVLLVPIIAYGVYYFAARLRMDVYHDGLTFTRRRPADLFRESVEVCRWQDIRKVKLVKVPRTGKKTAYVHIVTKKGTGWRIGDSEDLRKAVWYMSDIIPDKITLNVYGFLGDEPPEEIKRWLKMKRK